MIVNRREWLITTKGRSLPPFSLEARPVVNFGQSATEEADSAGTAEFDLDFEVAQVETSTESGAGSTSMHVAMAMAAPFAALDALLSTFRLFVSYCDDSWSTRAMIVSQHHLCRFTTTFGIKSSSRVPKGSIHQKDNSSNTGRHFCNT